MKKQGKYTLDRTKLSSEEINRMQDFDAVLKGAAAGHGGKSGQKGGLSSGLYIAGVLILILGVWLVWDRAGMMEEAKTRQVEQEKPETMPRTQEGLEELVEAPLVKPPVSAWDQGYSTYTLNAGTGGEIVSPRGTKISIPANCLLDSEGKVVTGPVEFRLREFHDPYSIALSGIPMHYDSAGRHYYFESAGMLELRAWQNGELLQLKPGSAMQASLITGYTGLYNVYQLDEEARNWKPRGSSRETRQNIDRRDPFSNRVEQIDESVPVNPELNQVREEISQLEEDKPLKPRKANIYRPRFDLKVNLEEFPELSGFENMQFEVAPEDKNFDPEHYKIAWNDIRLERYKGDRYLMILTKHTDGAPRVVELIVIPVFPEADYPGAEVQYEKLMRDYDRRLKERKDREEQLQAEAERKQQEAAEALRKRQELEARNEAVNSSALMRQFSMDGFGIWNCDNPVLRTTRFLTLRFADRNKAPLEIVAAYCLFTRNNGVYPLFATDDGSYQVPLSYGESEIILLVLDGQRIAWKKADELKTRPVNQVLELEPVSRSFHSAEEIAAYLRKANGY